MEHFQALQVVALIPALQFWPALEAHAEDPCNQSYQQRQVNDYAPFQNMGELDPCNIHFDEKEYNRTHQHPKATDPVDAIDNALGEMEVKSSPEPQSPASGEVKMP